MARKNKRNNGRGAPSNHNHAGIPPKIPVLRQPQKSDVEVPPAQDVLGKDFAKMLSKLRDSLPVEKQNELQEGVQHLIERAAEINASKEEISTTQQQVEQTSAALDSRKKALDEQCAQQQERESELQEQREDFIAKQASLTARERDIEERELDARNGFHLQNEKALQALKEQIEALERRRETLGLEIESERSRAREQIRSELDPLRNKLQEREDQLDSREATLDARLDDVAARERILKLNKQSREELVALVRQQEEEELSSEILAKARENEKLKEKVERYASQVEQLRGDLDEYSDLGSSLCGRQPSELLTELDNLRHENKELQRSLRAFEANEGSDEDDLLREEYEQLEEEVKKLRFELEGARQRKHSSRMVVLEREQWAQEKRVLERTKQVLTAQIDDLESRISSLIESTQVDVAFPELVKMDAEHEFQTFRPVDKVDNLKAFTQELRHRIALTQPDNPLYFRDEELQLFMGGLAMSQMHVFQGISGTGKTSLAKAFAKAVGGECQDIAVQAGWRDRSDLLGHYNSFEKRFAEKECLQALYKAATPSASDRVNIVLLDEMNLSRPEQYFADFLSALEKEPQDRWIRLIESSPPNAPKMLRDGREISVPENLWFIGTANQDETTNELADKTHDRAFVLELPRHEATFQPNKNLASKVYSISSLNESFRKAQQSRRKDVKELLSFISQSDLTTVLEKRFGIGWGNRFERQALKFIPVVEASGGTFELALDHLLSSRVFRNGKVTGRYDVNRQDLEAVQEALFTVFESISKQASPDRCFVAIERDIQRLERGA